MLFLRAAAGRAARLPAAPARAAAAPRISAPRLPCLQEGRRCARRPRAPAGGHRQNRPAQARHESSTFPRRRRGRAGGGAPARRAGAPLPAAPMLCCCCCCCCCRFSCCCRTRRTPAERPGKPETDETPVLLYEPVLL